MRAGLAWDRVPEFMRRPLRRGGRRALALALAADLHSARVLAECAAAIERGEPLRGDGLEALRLRPLRGRTLWLRRSSRDHQVVWDTFASRYHLPPRGIEPELILDLGAYTGMTSAHMAALWPAARVIAVELDAGNAAMARRNVACFGGRCTVVEAGVWTEPGQVSYDRPGDDEDAHRIDPAGTRTARALTAAEILADYAPGRVVDYAKLDIEGAEAAVLTRGAEWLDQVRAIKVEVHAPYSVERCAGDLEARGFRTRLDTRHWATVIGTRRTSAT